MPSDQFFSYEYIIAEQAIFWWGDVCFVLDQQVLFDFYTKKWIFIVLVHWNKSLQVDMSLHSHKLSQFWANQCFFGVQYMISHSRSDQLTITTFMWFQVFDNQHVIYHIWDD
jgi:hypothetical protein